MAATGIRTQLKVVEMPNPIANYTFSQEDLDEAARFIGADDELVEAPRPCRRCRTLLNRHNRGELCARCDTFGARVSFAIEAAAAERDGYDEPSAAQRIVGFLSFLRADKGKGVRGI